MKKKCMVVFLMVLTLAFIGCDSSSNGTATTGTGGNNENLVDDQVNSGGQSVDIPETVAVSRLDGDTSSQMAEMDPTALTEYMGCINTCQGNIAAYTDEEYMACVMNCYMEGGFTSDGAFGISISLTNTGTGNETVTLYAGTVFSPDSSSYQPMMIIQDITLTVEPGIQSFILPVYCLAPDLDAPDASNGYTITGLTTDTCLNSVLDILSTKDIDNFTFEQVGTVQDAIWNCVTDSYTSADTAALNALP